MQCAAAQRHLRSATAGPGAAGTREDICDDSKKSGDCALIGFGEGTTEYTAKSLKEMIHAVKNADITINDKKCKASEDADDD